MKINTDQIQEQMHSFISALTRDDLPLIKKMISDGFNVNLGFHRLASDDIKSLSIVQRLQLTPLGSAILKDNTPITEFLLSKGAITNSDFINYALVQNKFSLASKLIESAHEVTSLSTHKIFEPPIQIQQTNKILDALIRSGVDLDHVSSHSSLLYSAIQQNNLEGVKKLISHGVNIQYPIYYDFMMYRPVIEQALSSLTISHEMRNILSSIQSNPNLQLTWMKESILETLDSIPRIKKMETSVKSHFEQVILHRDCLKNKINHTDTEFNLPVLKKIQSRLNHILYNPVNQQPLLISKILDKNNIKNSMDTKSKPFSQGFPFHIARMIEDKVNMLSNEDLQSLRPIYRSIENLNQAIAKASRSKVISFDYDRGKTKVNFFQKDL